jgi:hypothetical protein
MYNDSHLREQFKRECNPKFSDEESSEEESSEEESSEEESSEEESPPNPNSVREASHPFSTFNQEGTERIVFSFNNFGASTARFEQPRESASNEAIRILEDMIARGETPSEELIRDLENRIAAEENDDVEGEENSIREDSSDSEEESTKRVKNSDNDKGGKGSGSDSGETGTGGNSDGGGDNGPSTVSGPSQASKVFCKEQFYVLLMNLGGLLDNSIDIIIGISNNSF